MRLIDADRLENTINDEHFYDRDDLYMVLQDIEQSETIDAKPVVNSSWHCWTCIATCKNCDREIEFNVTQSAQEEIKLFKYCPFCGAKMGVENS